VPNPLALLRLWPSILFCRRYLGIVQGVPHIVRPSNLNSLPSSPMQIAYPQGGANQAPECIGGSPGVLKAPQASLAPLRPSYGCLYAPFSLRRTSMPRSPPADLVPAKGKPPTRTLTLQSSQRERSWRCPVTPPAPLATSRPSRYSRGQVM